MDKQGNKTKIPTKDEHDALDTWIHGETESW